MAKKTEPTRGFYVDLDESLRSRIDAYCEAEGRSQKWLATKAITEWLDANWPSKPESDPKKKGK